MKKMILMFALALLGSGCAIAPRDAQPFSEAMLGKPDDESAILVLYRAAVPPFSYDARTFVNGSKVVDLPNEAFTWVRVPPGNTSVEMKWPLLANNPPATAVFQASAGETYFVRASFLGTGDWLIDTMTGSPEMNTTAYQESYDEAIDELADCCRYVPADISDLTVGSVH